MQFGHEATDLRHSPRLLLRKSLNKSLKGPAGIALPRVGDALISCFTFWIRRSPSPNTTYSLLFCPQSCLLIDTQQTRTCTRMVKASNNSQTSIVRHGHHTSIVTSMQVVRARTSETTRRSTCGYRRIHHSCTGARLLCVYQQA